MRTTQSQLIWLCAILLVWLETGCSTSNGQLDHSGRDQNIQEIQHKLDTIRINLSLESATWEDTIVALRKVTGLNILIDGSVSGMESWLTEEKRIEFRVHDMVLRNVLNKIGDLYGMAWHVEPKENMILFKRND